MMYGSSGCFSPKQRKFIFDFSDEVTALAYVTNTNNGVKQERMH